ncbi:MAG: ATP-binding protein [Xanthomonadales bacterium]|jgi:two-component system sensor histidine kinase PilS (NtrC family)|nr:ATP-binding protein [Xanthomonadales bacterium]
MKRAVEYTSWPLPESLTRKIVNYLDVYRLIITLILGIAHFGSLNMIPAMGSRPFLASIVLVGYFLAALLYLFKARDSDTDIYRLANLSLSTDAIFLSLLVILTAGIEDGIGILLVFTCGAAAIILPLRNALLLASFACLSMIGTASWGFFMESAEGRGLVQAGLFGSTALVTAILANQLAYWARDYRLIAEKRKAALTELEQANELIIRRMRTGVIAVDENNKIRIMNESAWFSMGSPKTREKPLRELSPRLDQALSDWKREPTSDPKPVVLEPSQANILPSFVALPAESGLGAMIFLTDNNVVARRAVELSVNSLAKLSGSIAHEIRNPLSALNHASQLLEESPQIRLSEMRLIHIIQNHAKRMNGIVENILQLSRREQSQPDVVPLHLFLPEFAMEFETSKVNHSLDFAAAFDTDNAFVLYDKSQLHQCLWKLLDNAVDHASRGNMTPRVRLRLRTDTASGFCVITIADNGPGINKEQLSKIFEPFYTTRKEGSGLGLYIARQLCEANQAELTVDSEPGDGAYFHIRMALAKGTAADEGQRAHKAALY